MVVNLKKLNSPNPPNIPHQAPPWPWHSSHPASPSPPKVARAPPSPNGGPLVLTFWRSNMANMAMVNPHLFHEESTCGGWLSIAMFEDLRALHNLDLGGSVFTMRSDETYSDCIPQPLALALEALRPPGSGSTWCGSSSPIGLIGGNSPTMGILWAIYHQHNMGYRSGWIISIHQAIVVIMWPFGDDFPHYSHHENDYSSANNRVMG